MLVFDGFQLSCLMQECFVPVIHGVVSEAGSNHTHTGVRVRANSQAPAQCPIPWASLRDQAWEALVKCETQESSL